MIQADLFEYWVTVSGRDAEFIKTRRSYKRVKTRTRPEKSGAGKGRSCLRHKSEVRRGMSHSLSDARGRSKQHQLLDGVDEEISSIDTQLRQSWETREETFNSKQNEEDATNEVHALAKQDLADTETKVASDKNFLVTNEEVTDTGWTAGGIAPMTRGAGETTPPREQMMQGLMQHQDRRREEPCLRQTGIKK